MRYYSFSFIIISSKAMIATIVQNVKIIFVKNILIIINTQFICQKDLFIAQTKILDCFWSRSITSFDYQAQNFHLINIFI